VAAPGVSESGESMRLAFQARVSRVLVCAETKWVSGNGRVCAETARLKVVWNVQMRGEFVCAETKWFRKRGDDSVVYLHILRELARIGMA